MKMPMLTYTYKMPKSRQRRCLNYLSVAICWKKKYKFQLIQQVSNLKKFSNKHFVLKSNIHHFTSIPWSPFSRSFLLIVYSQRYEDIILFEKEQIYFLNEVWVWDRTCRNAYYNVKMHILGKLNLNAKLFLRK